MTRTFLMDILGKYEQDHPQALVQQPSSNAVPSEGFLIRFVMKFSGGKIHDRRQALMILLIVAGIALFIAVLLIFQSTGVTQHPIVNAPPPGTVGKGSATQ